MEETVQHLASGKVREIFALAGSRVLLIASDRISVFWFGRTREIVPNHLLALRADGRSSECRRLEMLPLECVVRGYLAGSGWKDYQRSGEIAGHRLPPGLVESDQLPEPIFTPSTKALVGHAEKVDRARGAELVGEERYDELERVSLELYRFAAAYAAERGILLADTKFELGLDKDGALVLADEIFTPDSSRFWPADAYRPGGPQPSFDKQPVRDWTEATGWDKSYPGPELPEEVVASTRER